MQHEQFLHGVMQMFNDDPVIPSRPTTGLKLCSRNENTCEPNENCSKLKQRSCNKGKCELIHKIICEEPCEYMQCMIGDEGTQQKLEPLMTLETLQSEVGSRSENNATVSTELSTMTNIMTTTTAIRTTTSTTTVKEETTKNPLHNVIDFFKVNIHKFVTNVMDKENINHPFNIQTKELTIPTVTQSSNIKSNNTLETQKLNCKFYSKSGSFDCRNWNAPTLLWDLKQAQEEGPRKIANQFNHVMRYTERLHPIWKSIAADPIPPFSNEIITRHMFVYCINRFFIESEEFAFMSYRKRETDSMLAVIKIRMYCQIPLTRLREKLMLEAMQYFSDKCRTKRVLAFVKYVMRLVENEHEVDPKVEIELLAPALSLLIKRTAKQGWSKMKFYDNLMTKHAQLDRELPSNIQQAVYKTIAQSQRDMSLASVTSTLIDNIREQRLERKPRNFIIK